jgi:hypothetical protein
MVGVITRHFIAGLAMALAVAACSGTTAAPSASPTPAGPVFVGTAKAATTAYAAAGYRCDNAGAAARTPPPTPDPRFPFWTTACKKGTGSDPHAHQVYLYVRQDGTVAGLIIIWSVGALGNDPWAAVGTGLGEALAPILSPADAATVTAAAKANFAGSASPVVLSSPPLELYMSQSNPMAGEVVELLAPDMAAAGAAIRSAGPPIPASTPSPS